MPLLPCITSHHNSAFVYVFSLQVWEHLQRRNLVLKSAISQVPSTVTEMEVGDLVIRSCSGQYHPGPNYKQIICEGSLIHETEVVTLIPSRQPLRQGPHVTRGCHVDQCCTLREFKPEKT